MDELRDDDEEAALRDEDEEAALRDDSEDQHISYNGRGVAHVQQCGAPPRMSGVTITATSIFTLFPTDGSFVSTGLLVRLLDEFDSLLEYYCAVSVELFSFSFWTSTALVKPCILFMMFRKRLQNLLSAISSGERFSDDNQRSIQQCSDFLHFIECFVHRHIVTVAKQDGWTVSLGELIADLVTNMSELLTELEPLSVIAAQFDVAPGNTAVHKLSNQIGLLQVHTHWTTVATSYRLIVGLTSVGSSQSNLLAELAERILSFLRLLLDLAAIRFDQVPLSAVSGQYNQLLCNHTSIMELWLLTLQCLSHLANKGYTESFWSIIVGELENYLCHSNAGANSSMRTWDSVTVPSQPVSFCWWALTRVVILLQFDSCGVYHCPKQPFSSDPVLSMFIQQLVSRSLQSVGATVESSLLKLHLNCYHSIVMATVLSNESTVLLWEHFYKQFTDPSYLVSRRPLHNPQSVITSSVRQFYTYIKSLCSTDIDSTFPYKDEETFQIFLRIITRVIMSLSMEMQWKYFKGKIFSKFHRKKMIELSSDGLVKFLQLFLVLGHVTDVNEVGKKMITLLNMRNLASANEKSLVVLWRAIFTMLLTYSDAKCCLKDVVDIIVPLISQIVGSLATRSGDGSGVLLWDTVCVILNGIQELLDNSQSFTSGESALFGTYIGELLSHCKGNEIGHVVLFISDVISTISGHYCAINSSTRPTSGLLLESHDVSVEKLQHLESLSELTKSLWECVLPGLRDRVKDPTCIDQLAPLLGNLSDFSLECADLCHPHGNYSSYCELLLEEFAFDDSLPAGLVAVYLSDALSSDIIRAHVMSCDSIQLKVTHAWLRCLVQMNMPPACVDHVRHLTNGIIRLGLIGSIQPIAVNTESMVALKALLEAISSRHSSAATLAEASHWRDCCKHIIGDLGKYIIPLISGSLPSECMKSAYHVSSVAVRCCPKLIYSKVESRCLLPRLLDQLILPLATEKKPLPKGIPLMIRSHLHHFLMGLMQLEPKRDDFIRRKIKQIFLKYFTSYVQRSQPNTLNTCPGSNPFVLFLQPCYKPVVSSEARDALLFTMELVAAHFLTASKDSNLLPVLQYIGDVLEKITNEELIARCSILLLGNMLSCLLACETSTSFCTKPDRLRSQVITLMKKLLLACKSHPTIAPSSSLLPILREYLVGHLKQHQAATLVPLFTVVMEYPSLARVFLPTVERMMEECATSELRSAYHSLCDQC